MSHVDVKNLKPTTFEEENYDQYEFYNLSDKYAGERTVLLLWTWTETQSQTQPVCVRVCVCARRGLGPERQNQEGGQREHQPAQPVWTRAQDRGEAPEEREEGGGVTPR